MRLRPISSRLTKQSSYFSLQTDGDSVPLLSIRLFSPYPAACLYLLITLYSILSILSVLLRLVALKVERFEAIDKIRIGISIVRFLRLRFSSCTQTSEYKINTTSSTLEQSINQSNKQINF